MFPDLITLIAFVLLASLSAGGVVYALFYGKVSGEERAEKRIEAITDKTRIVADRKAAAESGGRKKSVQESLKELDARNKAKEARTTSPPLTVRLEQAGLDWSKRTFFIFSIICGLVFFGIGMMASSSALLWAAFAFAGTLGFPRWFVDFKRKQRMNKFLNELPNAVDVIVRGVKTGLPLGDCLRIIANEGQEPLKSEFRKVIEAQQMGIPMSDSVMRIYERVPVQEANFFGIVISIQSKAGGNLSEALGNLSRVLRERKKMKAKIKAVSQEAKASAGIIGSLPPAVMALVWISTPSYIETLFTTQAGNIILIAGGLWMLIGILVMRKMINFDF
jgi:tight adherence protein B